MRIAYFDCLSGISGDMTLGALIDAGASHAAVVEGVRSLGLGELEIHTAEVHKCGFRALQVTVEHPPEHAHRHLHQIEAMIDQADRVTPRAKGLAKQIFQVLGRAEAKVHGTTIEKVHFHEVGAIDSIADIVGTAIALDDLGVEAIEASSVPTGTGEVAIAHGRVAIPAPATAELLVGIPIAPSDVPMELTTPTGAAILRALGRRFGPLSAMTPTAIGYGAGQRDLETQANLLRVVIGHVQHSGESAENETATAEHRGPSSLPRTSGRATRGDGVSAEHADEASVRTGSLPPLYEHDEVIALETNIDNTTAEDLADCVRRLEANGALDVYQTPCFMKKGRAGVQLTVLGPLERTGKLERIMLQHSGTIGIRHQRFGRTKLLRREAIVETEFGPVRGKETLHPDGHWRFVIEYEDAARIAREQHLTMAQIRAAANRKNPNP